jgi:hypothetical protein
MTGGDLKKPMTPLAYRGSVRCDVGGRGMPEQCDLPAFGSYEVLPGEPRFCCRTHCETALLAGMYKGPLPEASEGVRVMLGLEAP